MNRKELKKAMKRIVKYCCEQDCKYCVFKNILRCSKSKNIPLVWDYKSIKKKERKEK